MKLFHLSDLHIGKRVNGFNLIDDQAYVLNQAITLIKDEKIDAVLISGDIFDKPIPPVEALKLFEDFLSSIIDFKIPVYIISGNHDNPERLSYLSNLIQKNKIYFAKSFSGQIELFNLNDEINIYLLPYVHPILVKKYFKDEKIENYNDAIKVLIKNTKIDKNKINIILAHQFVISKHDDTIISDSDGVSLGGLDWVDYKNFSKFDYCALGHLHSPQKVALDKIRYSGSILKYSFSEINQKKSFTIIDIKNKNDIKINLKQIDFKKEMKEYKGFIDEFLDEKFYSKINKDDYIHFILLDEAVIDAKKKLETIYPNIMLLEFDNTFTRTLNTDFKSDFRKEKSLLEHFYDFYKIQTGTELDKKILQDLSKEVI